jgi:UDP-glucose 4-epimerase
VVYGTAKYVPVVEEHPLDPENPYGASKVCGEKVIDSYSKCYGLDYAILRLTNVYGERDFERVIPTFIEKTLKNEALVVYGGHQILDFIHISDAIEAFLKALDLSENMILNIGSGEGVMVIDLANIIRGVTNDQSGIVLQEKRKGEVEHFTANIEKAERFLKWTPRTKLREGVSRLLKSYLPLSLVILSRALTVEL